MNLKLLLIKLLCLTIINVSLFSGCTSNNGNERPTVLATTSILGDILRNILPEQITVDQLMGPGVDPHLYKASQGDVQSLSRADVIVYNGLHLEGKMSEILERLSRTKEVIAFADPLPASLLRSLDSGGVVDPHIWFDLELSVRCVEQLTADLSKIFPDRGSVITESGKAYIQKLHETHKWCVSQINQLPADDRILITSHDAFGYFGDAYNFRVRGLQGISTLSESGLKDVTNMVNFIIDHKVKAVFVENSVPQKALRSVIEGCRRKGHEVNIVGELFSDALGEERTPEGTYVGMIRYNIGTIINALQ